MKKYQKATLGLSMALAVLAASCEKPLELIRNKVDKVGQRLEPGCIESCEHTLTFLDPGMCTGMWFQNENGEYLEVYGLSENRTSLTLEPGDRIEASYKCTARDEITCQAICSFESNLWESGEKWQTVELTCESRPDSERPEEPCTERLTYADPGLCSGTWFEAKGHKVYEVYGLPAEMNDLEVGEEYSFCFEAYDKSDIIQCEALCAYEVKAQKRAKRIEVVKYVE